MVKHEINGIDVTPVNTDALNITFTPANYKIHRKLGISVDLIGDDYTLMKSLEKDNFNDKHTYKITRGDQLWYEGVFLITDMSFDDDNKFCSIDMNPENEDTYITENEDVEVNVLTTANNQTITAERKTYWHFETGMYRLDQTDLPEEFIVIWQDPDYGVFPYTYFYTVICQERIIGDRQHSGFIEIDDLGGGLFLYGRSPVGFTTQTADSLFTIPKSQRPGGRSTPGPVNIWTSDGYPGASDEYNENVMIIKGYDQIGYYHDDVAERLSDDTWTLIIKNFNDFQNETDKGEIFQMEEYVFILASYLPDNNILDEDQSYNAITLRSALETIVAEAMPDFTGSVVSTTLFGDGVCPGEVEGGSFPIRENYPYYLIEMSDFKLPNASNPATIEKTTFKKLIDQLMNRLQLDWHIDLEGNLRIEHVNYYDNRASGLDLSTDEKINVDYSYEKNAIPNRQIFTESLAGSEDFDKQEILYGSVPAIEGVKENKIEINLDYLYTDIDYMNKNLDNAPNDGFMLVEVSNGAVAKRTGIISGESTQNAGLALSYAIYYYWRHRGYRDSFTFNGEVLNVYTKQKLKKHSIKVQQKQYINPKLMINTALGSGEVVEIKTELRDGGLLYNEIELRYE